MTIQEFADKHVVRLKKRTTLRIPERKPADWYVDNFPSVLGKYGFIRECGRSQNFIVTLLCEKPSIRRFMNSYRECKSVGMKVHGRGDMEGNFIFDPLNTEQAGVALRVIKSRKRRVLSVEQRENLKNVLQKARSS